ncbi:MAG: polysaccharide biosynthesis/export family protein [Mucilaginibacter sp.]
MKICVQKLLFICFFFFLASCSNYNKIPYFQDLDHSKISNTVINNYAPIKIQPGDLLGITISGNKEGMAAFNINEPPPTSPLFGYRVNSDGEIKLPLIGTVKAAELTTEELKAKLLVSLAEWVKGGDIEVRIINFKISVIGDVLRPNEYIVQNDRINILQALALAGDLNITAKRENLLLIREENGTRHYYPVNLTSKKLFALPYYYLQNNDVLVVEPDRKKYDQVDTKGYRDATLVLSALSVLGLLVSAVLATRK